MDEPEREPPQAEKPLTREDVLRLIKEHGGPEGLDLRKVELRQADLGGLDLRGALFREAKLQGARLVRANLQRADLSRTELEGAYFLETNLRAADLWVSDLQGAHFLQANLQRADLQWSDLQGADLGQADLRRARLAGASLRDANLEGANWGDYVLGEEIKGDYDDAASCYRALKQRHTEAGMYDVAGEFHYREMEARRKLAAEWWDGRLRYALTLNALRFLYGYGERPERVIGWAAAVVFGLALIHWVFGTVAGGFLEALYFSAVSFPALGYGDWSPEPQGWAGRFLGAGESFLGVFMMALFLVTFTRKMTR
jgi:hypothetical protein